MISRGNLWYLTLFSLILVLSIYYVTMPNDLLKDASVVEEEKEEVVEVDEVDSLVALRVSLEEERQNSINTLQEQLLSDVLGVNEKNNIYEQLKYLNELQSKEAEIEEEIKKQYNINCFIKIDNSDVESVCISDKHDKKLANNIMRLIQDKYKNKMYISVKFQKK